MQMRWRRETTHKAHACGSFRRILPRTPSNLFPLPLTVQQKKNMIALTAYSVNFPCLTVEGKRNGSGVGAGGAREKLLGPYLVFPRPSCIALNVFAFDPVSQQR